MIVSREFCLFSAEYQVYKGVNLIIEQAEIVHKWVIIKIPCFLQLKKAIQVEDALFAVSYFKVADET